MKKITEKFIRGYHRHSKAWYFSSDRDDIDIKFGLYNKKDGGTSGEMKIEWKQLMEDLAPRLKCFDDAWKILASFKDVIDEMAKVDNQNITEEKFVKLRRFNDYCESRFVNSL